MDHLAPPPDLPANAREIFGLWSVKDDVRTLAHVSRWPERVNDDETAIVYWPKYREFAIPVLDGGPSAITITHDPFSGKALPPPLRDEWFDTVDKLLGRRVSLGDTQVPDEFQSEAWWIARGL